MKKWWILKGLKIMFFVALAVPLFVYLIMTLWNALIPDLFHGPVLNWCQTIGLLILSKIFFGGFGGKHHGGGKWGRNGHWRERFEEKMSKMTPEERENFKQKFAGRCGGRHWDRYSEQNETKAE